MRIEQVGLVHVQVPLVEPFRISTASVDVKDAIICRVRSEGLEGIGESSPMSGSFYSADTPESCIDALRELLIPRLLGREISGPQAFHHLMTDTGKPPNPPSGTHRTIPSRGSWAAEQISGLFMPP
jgi:L-alanine-DL-glutamate epimerase-like enolase superfamily enzyme